MFSRPGVEDTEENLLRSQEEFLAGRLNPSATVVRASREDQTVSQSAGDKRILSADERDVVTLEGLPRVQPSTSSNHGFPPKKKSKFKERHQNKNEQDHEEHMDCADLLDIHDRHMTSVLSQIKERDIQSRHVMAPRVSQKGFPVALHREDVGNKQKTSTLKENSSESKKSLFAQQFAVSGSVSFGVPAQLTKSLQTLREASKDVKEVSNGTAIFFRSSLISGEGLVGCAGERGDLNQAVEKIHTENMAKLESMTEDEVLEEQARIKSTLDPSLIAFLTSRHKNNNCKSELMHADTTVDEREDKNIENASCAAGESSHSGKHVHFSDNLQMIPQENQQGIITANEQHEQSADCMTIGDLRVSRQWLHMDTVETEKLEWMKDCPVPSAVDSEQGDQARFDFDGNLLSKIDSIPEYIGLHHHGHDPSAAGYSLEELFVLARSSFLQQRVFALQVLARIIKQDQLGNFEGHLSDNLLSVLLDAGVLFLLRWALDDASEAVVAVAVQGLAAALIIPSDKESADQLFSFPRGHEVPALRPTNEKKEDPQNNEDKEEEKGLTDAEILKQDAVKGLIQMNILPRLRYILEVCSPATPTVCDILGVLTRISQHSTQVASEVLKCPRLVQTIFENFLPLSWKMVDQTGPVRGHPVSTAMQLVRSLCCAGRHVAATLISKYKLLDRILRYTALTPRNMQLSTEEAFLLYVESLRSWRVCVLYGLGCDAVRELYSFFIEHMQAIQSLSIFAKTPEERSELSCASAMFGLVEAVIYAAGTGTDQKSQINVSEQEEDNRNVALASLLLNWSHVTGFLPLIGECVTKWSKEILECNKFEIQSESLCLLSGAVAALTAYYSLSPDQAFHSPVEILQQLEHLANVVLLPLINSEVLDSCFMEISSSHNARGPKLCRKAIPSLPDYGSLKLHRKPGTQSPKVSVKELVGFASSWFQLFCQVAKQHKGIAPKFSTVLCKEAIVKYLKLVVKSSEVGVCFFFRQEHHLQYYLLKLAYNEVELTDVADFAHIIPLLHEVALLLFAKMLPGDEFYAFDLLSTVLLHSKFLCGNEGLSTVDVTEDLSEMSLVTPPMLSTYDTATVTRGELIAEAHKNLPSIRSMFVSSLQGTGRALDISRSLTLHHVRRVQSFLLPPCTEPLQPADWMFLPVVDLHNQAVSVEMKGKDIDTISEPAVSIVTRTLKLVLMLEQWRPSCLRHVSMASRIARLMCVFLTGNDLFFNSEVHDYLSVLLRIYTSSSKLKQLDFNSSIPGLTSFYDLYASLLAQFSAVSFGDPLFACFLILPLTRRHDIKFRKAVWEEHVGVLRALSIPLDQLPIPMEEFLYPVEQNQALLALYLRTLATEGVRPLWSPLFYLIAVHHVNSFVFQRIDPSDESGLKKKIAFLKQVLLVQNENIRHDILHYYKPALSRSSVHPFEKFTNLPADKQLLLRNRDSLEDCRQMYQTLSAV
ncbi:RNA polymerase II-associated protein 1-like isoform X1 [Montipora foliosa]|uniref:RNA polymerase II-associated protein 1-like isoform X1 n=2 Tax=Montipora foliosa TaxID=591990 RepID=UPI0035F12958